MNKYVLVKNEAVKILDNVNMPFYLYDNKKLDYLNLTNVRIFDEQLINSVIMNRINRDFANILDSIVKIFEDNDDDDTAPLMQALTETEKFKRQLINRDRAYLKKEHLELINKKIKLIENELKEKIYFITLKQRQDEAMLNYMENSYQEEYNDNYDNEYQGRKAR